MDVWTGTLFYSAQGRSIVSSGWRRPSGHLFAEGGRVASGQPRTLERLFYG